MPPETTDPLLNKTAPAFCLPGTGNNEVCLEQFRGKWVVLYFYPHDNTPGCTIEAMQFNAGLASFAGLGAQILGVSANSIEDHREFQKRHDLDLLLLSDPGHVAINAYGASVMGLPFPKRDTFLIDPAGTIVAVWRNVKPRGHADEVKAVLAENKGT
jgi:peroxiredoxin Q/BCP